MKRVASAEDKPIADIPPILRIGIVVAVEPELRIVPLEVEHVPVAVRIANLCNKSSKPPSIEFSLD